VLFDLDSVNLVESQCAILLCDGESSAVGHQILLKKFGRDLQNYLKCQDSSSCWGPFQVTSLCARN
jgi:hypothetical protein